MFGRFHSYVLCNLDYHICAERAGLFGNAFDLFPVRIRPSVYVSTEVCASYSMKADPDRNTTAELVAGHYSFYQFCTPFPPFKQINNTMEYEAGALTSALSL